MRNRFDEQLEQLNVELIKTGALCEDAISTTAKALIDNDRELARRVKPIEREIDQKERDIESLCMKLLLQQQPVARDLRQISAALKMITDMERIGDQASDIAEIILTAGESEAVNVKKIGDMASASARMVRDSVSAYVEKNLELARKVMEADDIVDELFENVKEEVMQMIVAGNNAGKAIDLIMIAKYLERIGDHATNIAEWVEFSITGIHKGQKNV